MNARTKLNVRSTTAARTRLDRHYGRLGGAVLTLALFAAPALAAPQIEVRVNNQVIASNQEVNFADTALGQSTPLIVVIRNVGDQDLVFTGDPFVSLGGGFDTYFSVIQPPLESGDKLSPNSSTACRIDFTPGHVADRLDTKAFIFTSATPAVFSITFAGRGVGPRMLVKQDGATIADGGVVIFPDTPIGQTSTVNLVIENAGNASLVLSSTPPATLGGGAAAKFAITQQPASPIAPGGISTMRIAFSPTAATAVTTGLLMSHNEQSLFHDGLFGALVQARGLPAADVVEEEEDIEEELNDNVNEIEEVDVVDEQVNDNVAEEEYENANDNQNDAGYDDKEDGKGLNDDVDLSPGGNPCGFGIGFAVPACLFGLCSARNGARRRVAGR